jgi:hypothetical protein
MKKNMQEIVIKNIINVPISLKKCISYYIYSQYFYLYRSNFSPGNETLRS